MNPLIRQHLVDIAFRSELCFGNALSITVAFACVAALSRIIATNAAKAWVEIKVPSTENQPAQSTTDRIVTFAFGALFVALSIAVFVVSDRSLGAVIGGIVIGGLGLDAMISAVRSKQSLLARIGPLP